MDTLRERLARNCPRTSPDKADHVLCIPGDSPCIACEAAAALDAHVCSCCAEREADWRAKREAQWKRENPMGSTLIETEPQKPTEHTLTLQFGRFLSRAEWREVAEQAWKLPHVQGLRADAVAALSAPAPAENANRLATFDDLPLAGHIERDGHPRAVVFVADVRAALSAPAGDATPPDLLMAVRAFRKTAGFHDGPHNADGRHCTECEASYVRAEAILDVALTAATPASRDTP